MLLAKQKPSALDKKPFQEFHRAGPLDHSPFARSSGYLIEQRASDRAQVRTAARDDEHRNAKGLMQPVEIDHVETGNGDTLQKHRMELGIEART